MNDSDGIDLTLLETFHAVLAHGTLTAAAAVLGRSQPAVWHRIDALQRDLDVRLFEKVGRRLVPTGYARALAPRSRELLRLAGELRCSGRALGDEVVGTVRIGTLPTLAAHYLAPWIATLTAEYPGVRLDLTLDFIEPLCGALRTGMADLAVVVGDVRPPDLEATSLGATRVVVVAAPDTLPAGDPIPVAALRAARYLAWRGPADPTFDAVRGYAQRSGLSVATTPGIPHTETLRELAAAGAGYTILPEYTCLRDIAAGRLVCARPEGLRLDQPLLMLRRPGVETRAVETVRESLSSKGGAPPRTHR